MVLLLIPNELSSIIHENPKTRKYIAIIYFAYSDYPV